MVQMFWLNLKTLIGDDWSIWSIMNEKVPSTSNYINTVVAETDTLN